MKRRQAVVIAGLAVAGLAIVGAAVVIVRPKPPPAVQAGRWQTTAVRKVNGATSEVNRGLVCLKGADATLERLVNPVEHREDCKVGDQSQADGVFRKDWICPGRNGLPEERIEMEVHYRQDGYDGIAKLQSKSATGLTPNGDVALMGKRVGDC